MNMFLPMYYVYIMQCADDSLYAGITTDVERRFKEHKSGKGGAYTRSKKAKEILYTEKRRNRSAALKREAEIKGWSRVRKLAFIHSGGGEYVRKAKKERVNS